MNYTKEHYQLMREELTKHEMATQPLHDLFMNGGIIIGWASTSDQDVAEEYHSLFGPLPTSTPQIKDTDEQK